MSQGFNARASKRRRPINSTCHQIFRRISWDLQGIARPVVGRVRRRVPRAQLTWPDDADRFDAIARVTTDELVRFR